MDQIISDPSCTYLLRLHGALCSPTIDCFGDVIITAQENGDTVVSLTINAASWRVLLDQFQDLSLTILPDEAIEKKNSDRGNLDDQYGELQ